MSNRTHCTRVGNAIPRPLPLPSGVVQGSCIVPLLFTVYITDVCKIFDADIKCKLYGDDDKLYSEIVVTDNDHTRLHENLDSLTRWSADWQLTISAQKYFNFRRNAMHCISAYAIVMCVCVCVCVCVCLSVSLCVCVCVCVCVCKPRL